MNIALRRPMTLGQFLAWEERQELRYEFDGVEVHAMTGGTQAHDAIQVNLTTALRTRLQGRRCRVHGSNLKIIVDGRVRYPDAFITCKPAQARSTIAADPVVVFEILSNGTSHVDLHLKNQEYRATESIQRYVILEQTHAAALVFSRKGEDWVAQTVAPGGTLRLPEAGIEVPLDELYIDVELESAADDDDDHDDHDDDEHPSPSVR